MSENKNPNRSITPSKGLNFFQDIILRIKLVLRLMGDSRVPVWLKLMPVGALVYVVWPIDIPGPIDDAAVLGLGLYLFVEMCPPDVVEEHLKALRPNLPGGWDDLTQSMPGNQSSGPATKPPSPPPPEGDVVDGEYHEVK